MKNGEALPSGWKLKKLGDLGAFLKGKGILKEELSTTGLPCIRYGEIYTTHDLKIKRFKSFISKKVAMESERIYRNDILFAGSGETLEEIGKAVAYAGDEEAYAGGDVVILRTDKGADAEYLSYALNTDVANRQKRRLGQGHSVVHIYGRDLAELKLPIPPLLEQRKIAKILSSWDRAIEKTELLIAQKQELKDGLMQQLLTGKVRFKEFVKSKKMKRTKLGMIPVDWVSKTLGDVCIRFLNGGTPSTKTENFWNGDIPWITGADFQGEKISSVRKYVTKEGVKNSSTNVIPKGWLLLVTRTGVGKMTIAPFDMAISQDLTGVEVNPKVARAEFLLRYLSFRKEKLSQLNQGTSINGITRDVLIGIPVPIPSLDEQKKIAIVILGLEKEVEKLEFWRRNRILQKRGLIKKLLTGKIRVKN